MIHPGTGCSRCQTVQPSASAKSLLAQKSGRGTPTWADTIALGERMVRVVDQMCSASPLAMRHVQHLMEVIPKKERADGKSLGERMVQSIMMPVIRETEILQTDQGIDFYFIVGEDDVIPGSTVHYIWFGTRTYSLDDRDLGMLLFHETIHARTYGGGPASRNNNNTFREEIACYFSEYLLVEEWLREQNTVEQMYHAIAGHVRSFPFYSTMRPGTREELDLHFTAYGVKALYTPEQWRRLSDFCDTFQARFKWS